ncbi:MAG: hypothetical protein ACLQVI_28950 [Polyangiaceae bacterium]
MFCKGAQALSEAGLAKRRQRAKGVVGSVGKSIVPPGKSIVPVTARRAALED